MRLPTSDGVATDAVTSADSAPASSEPGTVWSAGTVTGQNQQPQAPSCKPSDAIGDYFCAVDLFTGTVWLQLREDLRRLSEFELRWMGITHKCHFGKKSGSVVGRRVLIYRVEVW